MDNAIGVVLDEEGRLILKMKTAMRDLLVEVLPTGVVDGDFVTVDLTQLSATPERYAMIEDPPCTYLAFAVTDTTILPPSDLHRARKGKIDRRRNVDVS